MQTSVVLIAVLCAVLLLLGTASLTSLIFENNRLAGELADTQARLNRTMAENAGMQGTLLLMQAKISEKDRQVAGLASQLNETNAELNATASKLELAEKELSDAREELNQSAMSLEQAREEFVSLDENLTRMEKSLDESVQWFKDNSLLPASAAYFAPYVSNRCVDDGTLNLACVAFFMDRRLGFTYRNEEGDRLYSIDEMLTRGGGDCEDYSLFLKALLNTLAPGKGDLQLMAWKPGDGQFRIYESEGHYWYYNGRAVRLAKLDEAHPYDICYAGVTNGHCIVALSANAIGSVDGMGALEGAAAFEPQNGEYMGTVNGGVGTVGDGDGFHLCRNGEKECGQSPGDIFIVMADDDIYQFRDGRWESLDTQHAGVETLRKRIAAAIGPVIGP
jgi:hypothetical protein